LILLLSFLAPAILIIVTPGPDNVLVVRNGLRGGRKSALLTSLGIGGGLLVWTGLSAVGVAFVLEASAFAYTTLRLAGAAYLTYLGVRGLVALRKAKRSVAESAGIPANGLALPGRIDSPFLQGLFSDILNPKTAIVFTSLTVQFVTPGPSVAVELAELGGVFSGMALCWLALFSMLIGATGSLLGLPRVRRALDAVTGVVLIGLGVWVATET
jgi:threonine/homoserine/homoserine lactone efflux protein